MYYETILFLLLLTSTSTILSNQMYPFGQQLAKNKIVSLTGIIPTVP